MHTSFPDLWQSLLPFHPLERVEIFRERHLASQLRWFVALRGALLTALIADFIN